jgi:N-acetylglutamate synthase-like GNAT family acetyltransferase
MKTYQIKEGIAQMDMVSIHHFLSQESYWAKNITLQTVEAALRASFCIGVFDDESQVGFARLVTDYATFAYLADVYILSAYRGNGLSKMLMKYLMDIPWTKDLRRIMLVTSDAHGLYKQFGFDAPNNPGFIMEINRKDIYNKG